MTFLENILQTQVDFFSTNIGTFVFIVFYVFWVTSLLPGSWISMLAGLIYGSLWGTVFVFIGASLGAILTFYATRTFLREWIQKRISSFPKLELIEKSISREGIKIIILSRLSPAFPFGLLNLYYGLSNVKFRDFLIGLIAILPGTFLYCSLGNLAGEVSRFNEILTQRSEFNTFVFTLIGFLSTILVVFVIFRGAQKSFQNLS